MRKSQVELQATIETPDGTFLARYSERGLCGLAFPPLPHRKTVSSALPEPAREWHRITSEALGRALRGEEPKRLPPLDLSAGTEFQQQVWQALRKIRCGNTCSYGEVAGRIGRAKAIRAVGGACGANPIPVLVPCHRVLAANKRLGGFSGGLDWKRKLLSREQSWTEEG